MGNIIGEGFDDLIIGQVKVRQEKLGQYNNINDDILRWRNAKTSWVKLTSAVDIEGSTEIAKQNVLFGGTSIFYYASGNNLRTGFIEKEAENSNLSTYQYSNDFGYRPMPSITDVSVDYLNRGSLRKAEIKIKAYSVDQLEVISKLYMSVGFTVLLEWGHTTYLDNNGNVLQFNNFLTDPFNKILQHTYTQDEIFASINKTKKDYFGNYDALYGKVTKFNWSFNEDGSYDISINVISVGDIIESLKINIAITNDKGQDTADSTNTEDNTEDQPSTQQAEDYLISLKDVSTFHTFLYEASQNEGKLSGGTTAIKGAKTYVTTYNENISKNYNMNPFDIISRGFKEDKDWSWDIGQGNNTQFYIKLGSLLNFMQNNCNLFVENVQGSPRSPYVTYDTGSENYCCTFTSQYSSSIYTQIPSDPCICVIPFKDPITKVFFGNNTSNFTINDNPYVGRIMEIEVSLSMIADKLYNSKNEKGDVQLLDFLNQIISSINLNLGSINQLEIFYDADDNIIRIIENAPLRYNNLKTKKEYAKFNLYGVAPDLGSFINKFNFDVTISNDMATMITVGAQSEGNAIGENATSLSNLYNSLGLTDRISLRKFTTSEDVKIETSASESTPSKLKKLAKNIHKGIKNVWGDKRTLTSEDIETIQSNNNDYANLIIGDLASVQKAIPAPMFLPFELKMSMEGLGGMKIYQKFTLTPQSDKILPDLYRDNNGNPKMDFLIKNLSHKISNNTWTTDISAYTVPTEPNTPMPTINSSPSEPSNTQSIPTNYTTVSCQQEAAIRLSPNYNLAQLSCAAPAAKYSIPAPGQTKTTPRGTFTREQIINNLTNLATNVIEIIKARYPTVIVTNAYRNKGGNSQHEIGEAVDLQFSDITGTLSSQNALMLTRAQGIKDLLDNANGYDQFLLEYKTNRGGRPWMHISYKRVNNRRDVRTFLNDSTAPNGAGRLYNPLA
jgi:hypothetical protein